MLQRATFDFKWKNGTQRAREQFRLCADSLAKQLGIGPSADLKRLVSGIGVT